MNPMSPKTLHVAAGLTLFLVFSVGMASAAPPYAANLQFGQSAGPVESAHDCNDPGNLVGNCGYEADGVSFPPLTAWTVTDAASPFIAVQTVPPGSTNGFGVYATSPTEGAVDLYSGFDGAGPDTIQVGQDITLPAGGSATLQFDYRGAWDLQTFGASLDRTLEVRIEPAGGGVPMQTDLILTATAGTAVNDTGPLSATVDLSAFTGQTVHLNFVATIPENFSGPGQLSLDNVLVTFQPITIEIPTVSQVGMAILLTMLAMASVFMLRRRRIRG